MSLPLPWIDRIFMKLTLVYGQPFLNRWRDLDIDAVKFDWSKELDGFDQHPTAIAFALQNLDPEKPPTALMFRAIANRAPAESRPALPSPAADPARMAEELSKLAHVRRPSTTGQGMKDWAHRLKRRHDAGETLNLNQIRCFSVALGLEAA